MKNTIKTIRVIILAVAMMTMFSACSQENDSISDLIIGMEKSALERWNNGDPSGFIEISADDVVYFDPMMEQRLDGLDKLTEFYETARGKVHVDRYDMINPKVQSVDNMAVLTYNLISYIGETGYKWNCTEVYRRDSDNTWKIIQTHWSPTKTNDE